ELPPKVQTAYDDLENAMWAMIDAGDLSAFGMDGDSDADADRAGDGTASPLEIRAKSAAGARTKCRQIANGALKGLVDTDFQAIHDRKLQELDRVMHEANGRPVLLAYAFRADMHRILARYSKEYRCAYIGPGTKDSGAILDGWTRGDYHLLVSHPASIGHGVDGLQTTCNEMVWFGLTDNLRWYRQFGARIRRLGQPQSVVHVRHIVARNTVDEAIAALLTLKDVTATELRQALSDYRRHKGA
ncbi:MAG: hypothetical protein WBP49_12985, partial [Acidimicrobiia bacterium]